MLETHMNGAGNVGAGRRIKLGQGFASVECRFASMPLRVSDSVDSPRMLALTGWNL